MRRSIYSLLFILLLPFIAVSQQTVEKFTQELRYLLALPQGYEADTSARWPLLIFLHGSGERGTDIEKVKAHGPPKLIEQGKKFPFILVSPQGAPGEGWNVDLLYKMLQQLKQSRRVDPDRVYLTGLSMGGFGTFSLAAKYPGEFAAIAPVCGGGDSSQAWKLRHIPIWCFHGAKDDVVLPIQSERMVIAARRENPSVKFTVFPEANHNSWDDTYDKNDSLYNWLLQQKRFHPRESPAPIDLKAYAGSYVGNSQPDTLHFFVKNGALYVKGGNEEIPVKSTGNHIFYLGPEPNVEFKFELKAGQVTGFLLSTDERSRYRKLK